MWTGPMFNAISKAGKQLVDSFNGRDVANTAWAFATVSTAAVDRFDRSRDLSMGSIDAVDSDDFRNFGNVRELEICLVSKFQLCTTLGGRKNAEKPERKHLEFLSSSIRSVR